MMKILTIITLTLILFGTGCASNPVQVTSNSSCCDECLDLRADKVKVVSYASW